MTASETNQITLNIESLDSIIIKVKETINNNKKCYLISYELNGVNYLTPAGNFYSKEIEIKNDIFIQSEFYLNEEILENVKMFPANINTDIVLTSDTELTEQFRKQTIYQLKKYFTKAVNIFYRFEFNFKEFSDVEFDGIDNSDTPDFCDAFVSGGVYKDEDMNEFLLNEINENYYSDVRYELLCKFKLDIL